MTGAWAIPAAGAVQDPKGKTWPEAYQIVAEKRGLT
jgi:hypothetical protein